MNIKNVNFIEVSRETYYNNNLEKFYDDVVICLNDEVKDGLVKVYYGRGFFQILVYVNELEDMFKQEE